MVCALELELILLCRKRLIFEKHLLSRPAATLSSARSGGEGRGEEVLFLSFFQSACDLFYRAKPFLIKVLPGFVVSAVD
jgi:hypothetical protein